MTSQDAPPTRRARREVDADEDAVTALLSQTQAQPGQSRGSVAFGWVDEASVAAVAPASLDNVTSPYVPVEADLLVDAPRRSPWRPGVLLPIGFILLLVAAYCATTLLWPLHAVAPTVSAVLVQPATAPAATPPWPAEGSAAVAVAGIDGTLSSSADTHAIASITKVLTALVVLDQMPLAVGEQGPDYRFTASDRAQYWEYLRANESALDVPVGGTLTEYQMLQGMLLGSAGNYADRLASTIWPNDRVFAAAARTWMDAHGVPGITIVEPTGIQSANSASPAALIQLAERAMANPVIAEIVGQKSVTLPGAGLVTNTNKLLADAGVVGIKTGSLDTYNLLAAKDVTVGGTSVRLYAATLGQPDDDARVSVTGNLFAQLQQELTPTPAVAAGTVAGVVETRWGERVDVITAAAPAVVLWNGGTGVATTTFDLGDRAEAGDVVGALTVTGPLDAATVDLALADDVEGPSPWWRLTHPLDLFGLND